MNESTCCPTRLYLLRHGSAARARDDDASRPLTAKGRRQCAQIAALLRRLEVAPDQVVISPLLRARQTAEEVLVALGSQVRWREEPGLAPGEPVGGAIRAALRQGDGARCILVVGHEPLLSLMATALLGEVSLHLEVRKGGLLELDLLSLHPPRAILLGLLRPAHLRET